MTSNMSATEDKTKPKYRKPLPEMPLDDWVTQRTNMDYVKFYKSRSDVSLQYPLLRHDGFFLLMMTKSSMNLMKSFSEKVVCIDKQKGNNFEVITLTVIDNLDHSMPCAVGFADRIDQAVVEVFFLEIKSVIGSANVKLLVSSNESVICDPWSQIVGQPEKNVCSSWETIHEWKKILCLIPNETIKPVVLKQLKMLLKEPQKEAFIERWNSLNSELSSDIETAQFAKHMVENYCQNISSWATCFVFETNPKVHHQLEMMHMTFRHILRDKTTKRLDRAVSNVKDLMRSKVYERLVIMAEDRSKAYPLIRKHKLAENCTFRVIERSSYWNVFALTGKKEKHKIRYGDKECKCVLKCDPCGVCCHVYKCSCADSNARSNMCRHIHGLCKHKQNGTVEHGGSDSEDSDVETEYREQPQSQMDSNMMFVEREVDVACHNLLTDDTGPNFDCNVTFYVEGSEGDIYECTEQSALEQDNLEEINFEVRKGRLKSLFQTVLNDASNENHLQEIENTLCILQDKIRGVKRSRKSTKRPPKREYLFSSGNEIFAKGSCKIKKPRN